MLEHGHSRLTTITGLTSTGYDYTCDVRTLRQTNTMTTSASALQYITPDTTAPVITNIQATSITSSGVTFTWTTNENATSRVEYGLTSAYGSLPVPADPTADNTSHSVTISGLTSGTTYHFRALSTDSSFNAGISGDNSFDTVVVLDIIDPPPASFTTSSTIVNSDSYTISGTAGADTPTASVRTISVYNGATLAGTAVVPVGQTDWSVLVALTQNATSTFTALSTDAAGNVAAAAGSVDIGDNEIIDADLTAPDAPVLSITPVIVDEVHYQVSGTAASDGGVRSISILNGSIVVGTVVLPAGAIDWSVTVALNQSTTNSFTAKSSDEAGNTSAPSSAVVITEATAADTTAPVVSNIQSSSITASSASISWSTNELATSRIEYGLTSAYGSFSAVDASADNTSHSVALSSLTSGSTYHYRVISGDTLGNIATSTDNVFDTLVIADTTAPAVPALTIVDAATNADTYTVAGTVATDGSTRLVSVYNGATLAGTVSVPASQTSWTILVPLTQGTANIFTATASDSLGNTSVASAAITITEVAPTGDNTAPAIPVITTGTATVDSDTYTITGTAGADTPTDGTRVVTIYRNGTVVGSLSLSATQTAWSFVAPLLQGTTNAFTAYSTDASGNVSAVSNSVTITEATAADTTPPGVPAFTTAPASIDANTYTLAGTVEDDGGTRIVSIYNGETLAGTVTVPAGQTAWSFLAPLTQDSENVFVATATDVAGNVSGSEEESVTITEAAVTGDNTAPPAPVITTIATTVDATEYTISGTAGADTPTDGTRTVTIYRGDIVVGSISLLAGSTSWSFIAPLAQATSNSFTAMSTDSAGNSSGASDTVVITEAEGSATLAVTNIGTTANLNGSTGFATADNTFDNGWAWTFRITVPSSESILNLKFADFVSGSNSIPAASNIRFYSAQSSNASASTTALTIGSANTYSGGMNLSSDLDANTAGRQVEVRVEVRVPTSTAGGSYSTGYGVRSSGAI